MNRMNILAAARNITPTIAGPGSSPGLAQTPDNRAVADIQSFLPNNFAKYELYNPFMPIVAKSALTFC